MKVIEAIRKYNLAMLDKHYVNSKGVFFDLVPLDQLAEMEARSINISCDTNEVTIEVPGIEDLASKKKYQYQVMVLHMEGAGSSQRMVERVFPEIYHSKIAAQRMAELYNDHVLDSDEIAFVKEVK